MEVPMVVVFIPILLTLVLVGALPRWAIKDIYQDNLRNLRDDLFDHVHRDEDLPDCPASEQLISFVDTTIDTQDLMGVFPLVTYRLVQWIPSLEELPVQDWESWPDGTDMGTVSGLHVRYRQAVTGQVWFGSWTGLIGSALLLAAGLFTLRPDRFLEPARQWTFMVTRQVAGNPDRYARRDADSLLL